MSATFLGWKHPGLIEAPQGWSTLPYPWHFWDGNIPASLKPPSRYGGPAGESHFWDGNIPASLKRFPLRRDIRLILISGMETSRPH